MDLSRLVSKETADCTYVDPHTGLPTDIVITVYGMDSAHFRNVMKSEQAEALKAKAEGRELPEGKAVDAARLAKLTAGWSGIERDGKPIPFDPKSCAEVYEMADELRRQVDRFIFRVANFLPKA